MTYTKNIPLTGESLGSTRARISENFSDNFDVQAVNHVSFNDSGAGKHKFMQMPEQPSAPSTAVNEGALYTKQGINPSEASLLYRGESNGFEYQITKPNSAQTSKFGKNVAYGTPPMGFTQSGGWTFLAGDPSLGGLILQYGFFGKSADLGSSGTIEYPIPFTTGVFSLTTGLQRTTSGNQTVTVVVGSLTQFSFFSSSSSSVGS